MTQYIESAAIVPCLTVQSLAARDSKKIAPHTVLAQISYWAVLESIRQLR
jgi:hypothetical protein